MTEHAHKKGDLRVVITPAPFRKDTNSIVFPVDSLSDGKVTMARQHAFHDFLIQYLDIDFSKAVIGMERYEPVVGEEGEMGWFAIDEKGRGI